MYACIWCVCMCVCMCIVMVFLYVCMHGVCVWCVCMCMVFVHVYVSKRCLRMSDVCVWCLGVDGVCVCVGMAIAHDRYVCIAFAFVYV